MRAKWFCCAFNLGFLQLICKASLIFKSNLLLALSIILKQRHFNKASYKDALSICKRLLCSTISRRNKELQDLSKELCLSENVLSKQLSTTDIYILTKSITLHNKKLLQKLLNTQQKKLSSLTRNCILSIFTANEAIATLTQDELSREESDLLKAGLYFSIEPDKIRKSEIFTTFEKTYRSFLNNLKSEER